VTDLRLLDAHMRETYARKGRVGSYLVRLGRTYGYRTDAFVERAVDVVLAGQIEQARATWEVHSLAAELADPLGRSFNVEPPLDVMIGAATHDGTPLETVYRRPGLLLGELAAEGVAATVAQSRAETMAVELADVDLSVAGRKAEQVRGMVDRRVVGYRRVPNSGACRFCRYIATQRYKTGTLAPAHAYCGCGTAEIYGTKDPGQIIDSKELERIKKEGVPTRYGSRKESARRASKAAKSNSPIPNRAGILPTAPPKAPTVKPPVDTRPPANYSKAKSREDVVALFETRHPGTKFSPGGWDAKTARLAAEALDDVMERFPLAADSPLFEFGNMREVYPRKSFKRGVQGVARSNPFEFDRDLGEWVVRADSRNGAKIGVSTGAMKSPEMARQSKAAGWWSTDAQTAVVVHEYGHHVGYSAELALLRKNVPDGRAAAISPNVRIVGNRDGGELWQAAVSQRISDRYLDGGPVSWQQLTPTIKAELSEYAATNGREVMAEAFAEVALRGDEARPLAKLVVELAYEIIEEGKTL
jgi:hypothetical protein